MHSLAFTEKNNPHVLAGLGNLNFTPSLPAAFGIGCTHPIRPWPGKTSMVSMHFSRVEHHANPVKELCANGVPFWGIIPTASRFTSTSLGNTSAGAGVFAFDNRAVGTVDQGVTNPVPEPGSLALWRSGDWIGPDGPRSAAANRPERRRAAGKCTSAGRLAP